MAKQKHPVEWQRLRVVGPSTAQPIEEGLPEQEVIQLPSGPSEVQLIMGEAIALLKGRQKEVYLLTMRQGKSIADAAKILNIAKGAAQTYKLRAIKHISDYCQAAILRGEV